MHIWDGSSKFEQDTFRLRDRLWCASAFPSKYLYTPFFGEHCFGSAFQSTIQHHLNAMQVSRDIITKSSSIVQLDQPCGGSRFLVRLGYNNPCTGTVNLGFSESTSVYNSSFRSPPWELRSRKGHQCSDDLPCWLKYVGPLIELDTPKPTLDSRCFLQVRLPMF